jgi:hypothetical protein
VNLKGTIPYFVVLFAVLILNRATGFHVYAHDDGATDIENCMVCDVLLDAQSSGFQVPEPVASLPSPVTYAYTETLIQRVFDLNPTALTSGILSRPPPALA